MFVCRRCGDKIKSKDIIGTHVMFSFASRYYGLYKIRIDHPVCERCQREFRHFWGINYDKHGRKR